MNDEPELPPPVSAMPTVPARLKSLGITFTGLFAAWLFVAYVLPHFILTPHPSRPVETPAPPAANETPRVEQLEARLSAQDAKIDALQETVANLSKAAPQTPPAPAETAPPAAEPAVPNNDQQLNRIEGQLTALQTQLSDAQAKNTQLAAMLALGRLKDAIDRGEPLAASLAQLKNLAPTPQATDLLTQLAPFSDKGVPTLADLRHRFEIIASQAHSPDNSTLMNGLHSLVRIRKIGEPAGTDDESIIARAETKLGRGDVDGSVKELSALSTPNAALFAPWLEAANSRLHAQAAARALESAQGGDHPVAP